MFKKYYLLNLVNILSKFYGLLLFLLSLLIFHNNIIAVVISVILLILTRKRKYFIYISLTSLILSLINLAFPHLLWLVKICFLIEYLIYLSDLVDIVNAKKIYENSLYSLKNNFLTKGVISFIYFMSIFKKNFNKLDKPRVENGIVTGFGYITKLSIKSFNVSVSQIKNIILYHRLRFYNIENRRESIDKIVTRKYDYYYIGVHVLLLVLSIITRFI